MAYVHAEGVANLNNIFVAPRAEIYGDILNTGPFLHEITFINRGERSNFHRSVRRSLVHEDETKCPYQQYYRKKRNEILRRQLAVILHVKNCMIIKNSKPKFAPEVKENNFNTNPNNNDSKN